MRMHILLGGRSAFVFFTRKTKPSVEDLAGSVALTVSYRGVFHWLDLEDSLLFDMQAKATILKSVQLAQADMGNSGYTSMILPELQHLWDRRYG